jgi:amino acid permease
MEIKENGMSTMIRMVLLGVGAAGVIGGPYILYLAFTKPRMYPKPKLAKWQGAAAFLIGAILLFVLYRLGQK